MKITYTTATDLPPDAVERMRREINELTERAIYGGWPPGYDSERTPPASPVERCCYGSVIHAPNCKTWGVTT